jgi:hypothetical protein
MPKATTHARFGSLGRDGRGVALQTATMFTTQDSASPPLVSPVPDA